MADFWGFCSPARKWLAPLAVKPVGVHDQLYKTRSVEMLVTSNISGICGAQAPSPASSVSFTLLTPTSASQDLKDLRNASQCGVGLPMIVWHNRPRRNAFAFPITAITRDVGDSGDLRSSHPSSIPRFKRLSSTHPNPSQIGVRLSHFCLSQSPHMLLRR